MKRVSKILSIALSAVLLLGALSVSAGAKATDELTPWFFNELAEGDTLTLQNVEKLLLVNDWIWDETCDGSFTIQTGVPTPQTAQYSQDELPTDELQWSELQPDEPEMIGRIDAPAQEDSGALYSQSAVTCTVGETFKLKGATNGGRRERNVDMVCLYVGTYCTVWGTTSDKEAIQLTGDMAEKIGKYFDEKFPKMRATFGDDFIDANGDGKVAIMCYDIDEDYEEGKEFYGQYTGGFFDMKDMIRLETDEEETTTASIGGVLFQMSDNYPGNSMDCIRIDTYPVMGNTPDTLMTKLDECCSTLFHEFQHMLNFSSALRHCETDETYYLRYMDTFLNEAFSMAAEHLICGSNSTASRIDRFNGSSYKPGSSLTSWTGTLDNYANSYLFGQYLRTRWKQSENAVEADGSDFYRTVYAACVDPTDENGKHIYDENGERVCYNGNAMNVIADLFRTYGSSLTIEFWTAVCLNQSSGKYGFAGEEWADAIQMKTSGLWFGTSNDGVANSGAKLYQLDPSETYTITAAKNCTLVAMTRAHGDCGENVTWSLSPDGALYIEGDGSAITSFPWQSLPAGTQISSVSLPAGLTSVPENAFAGLDSLDYVAFAGTVAEWQAIQFGSSSDNGNGAVQNAACKYFDGDFVRMYLYEEDFDWVSLLFITEHDDVSFAAAMFDENGRFVDYTYVAPGSQDDSTGDDEYGGYIDFNAYGAAKFSVMAFTEGGPIGSARTFQLP